MMIVLSNGASLYGNFRARTFSDIFDSFDVFETEFENTVFSADIGEINLDLVYYLLYARYGNSTIASSDENQFKYKLFSTIFMYAPAWAKRLEIQKSLIGLTEDEILTGSTAIYNQALNPSQAPTTQTLEELTYINQQNTTKYKKSKLEGYAILEELIKTDVTEEFIGKFKKLFITVVEPDYPLWYRTEGDL